MDVLTPSQYKILDFAWQSKGFTLAEISESEVADGRKDATLRTVCDRITDKGFMLKICVKNEPVQYRAAITKQDYHIRLAREWFSEATEEDKQFFKWAMDQV
jgi:predicted transcriptional regulator